MKTQEVLRCQQQLDHPGDGCLRVPAGVAGGGDQVHLLVPNPGDCWWGGGEGGVPGEHGHGAPVPDHLLPEQRGL